MVFKILLEYMTTVQIVTGLWNSLDPYSEHYIPYTIPTETTPEQIELAKGFANFVRNRRELTNNDHHEIIKRLDLFLNPVQTGGRKSRKRLKKRKSRRF